MPSQTVTPGADHNDFFYVKLYASGALPAAVVANLKWGFENTGKITNDMAAMFIFSLSDIPSGATIQSVSLQFQASGSDSGNSFSAECGFLDRDGRWEVDGLHSYTDRIQLPLPEANAGGYTNPSAWITTPSTFTMTNQSLDNLYTIADGVAGTYTATGLVAQAQAMLDTYGGSPLQLAFWMHKPYTGVIPNPGQFSGVWSYDASGKIDPQITIEWVVPGGVLKAGRVSMFGAVSGLARVRQAVSGRTSAFAAVSGRPHVDSAVSGRASLFGAVKGRSKIQ